MPTYLYLCPNHGEFEDFHSMAESARLQECPQCRSQSDISIPVRRLISPGGSKGVVELTGHEYIEKAKSDADKFKREVYSSEKQYSNILGETKYQELQTRMDKQRR